jgi:hypothetical protein
MIVPENSLISGNEHDKKLQTIFICFCFAVTDSASCTKNLPILSTELFDASPAFRTFHLHHLLS